MWIVMINVPLYLFVMLVSCLIAVVIIADENKFDFFLGMSVLLFCFPIVVCIFLVIVDAIISLFKKINIYYKII